MEETVRSTLDSQDWEPVLKRLVAYAHRRLKQMNWNGVGGMSRPATPGGKDAWDFGMQAITDIFTGTRRWDPETEPDLFLYLTSVVNSLISNELRRKANRAEQPLDEAVEDLPDPCAELGIQDDFAWDFLASIEGEPDLHRISECIVDGIIKRADIATHLGLTPIQVTNAGKRLVRRLTQFIAERECRVSRTGATR